MSTLKTNNVQVGQSVTATNNFTLYQPSSPDGTVRLGVGNSGATTADVLTLNGNGALALRGAVTSASGVGITFPATQSASTDANTLDDYEEGTFTPTLTAASGSNGGLTATGSYTKIGRLVYVSLGLTGISKGTLSGQLSVGGLPFSVSLINSTATCRWDLGGGTPPSGMTLICPQSGGGTGFELQAFGASGYLGNLAASNFGSTFNIYNITYCYQTT